MIEVYRRRCGEHIPLIRRQDVKGFYLRRRPSWFTRTIRPEDARDEAALMEIEARRFYEIAGWRPDGTTRTEAMPAFEVRAIRYRAPSGR